MNPRQLLTAAVSLLIGLSIGCSQSSGPSDPIAGGSCVTDFSCPYGEECDGAACAPVGPSLYPHIQTASALLRAPVDDAEITWRAQHYDLLIGGIRADQSRAANAGVRMLEYMVGRYDRFEFPPKTASAWALAHGYDPEDFYLHYRVDTYVPTWEGRTIVPGFPAGMVPGWNPGGSNASATSRDQSRVVAYYSGGEPWYPGNVSYPGYREFLAHFAAALIDGTWYFNQTNATGPIDGIMCDEAIWYPIFGEGLLDRTDEYYGITVNDDHPYTYAVENMYPRLAADLMHEFDATMDVMPNYGHVLFLNYPNRCAQNIQKTTPWIWGEVWVTFTGAASPTSGSNRCITENYDYEQAVAAIVRQTRKGGRRVLGARDTFNGTAGTDRGKLLTLGLYYLVHDQNTYYMYETDVGHRLSGPVSTWAWNPAVEFDIGQADQVPVGMVDFEGKANTKEHYVFATGPDPVNPALTYHVYARRFTNALVLVKLLPAGSTVDDTSITNHTLDGSYGVLQADGTIGPTVTQASIRNNEALILIPLD